MKIDEKDLLGWTFAEAKERYKEILVRGNADELRWFCRHDRFFLLVCGLGRADACHPWIYDRAREVQANPTGFLDLWSRFHYKSTIITLAGAVQEILLNPNITIGIFSNTIKQSKKFVAQIKRAVEGDNLKSLFPDILHAKPPMIGWSVENGLIVIRPSNPKEPTVQAAGLLDGQPIGAHYDLRIYDDIVTPESVSTPEQIRKTTEAWELSLALGTASGGRAWYAGTRYHPQDTYQELLDRGALKERRRICSDADGKSVLMPQDKLDELRREMGDRTFSAQMLQTPIGTGVRTFRDEWWQTLEKMPDRKGMNVYVFIDSANQKRKHSDYTTMWVVGLAQDRNYYVLDGIHDRINLAERTSTLFDLVERWSPSDVFWEQVGLASDVEHVRLEQDRIGWHFKISAFTQSVAKEDRIGWLVPLFGQGRIWFQYRILHTSAAGELYDCTHDMLHDEYSTHPISKHDDMLDCLANISHPSISPYIRFPISPTTSVNREPARRVWDPQQAF